MFTRFDCIYIWSGGETAYSFGVTRGARRNSSHVCLLRMGKWMNKAVTCKRITWVTPAHGAHDRKECKQTIMQPFPWQRNAKKTPVGFNIQGHYFFWLLSYERTLGCFHLCFVLHEKHTIKTWLTQDFRNIFETPRIELKLQFEKSEFVGLHNCIT